MDISGNITNPDQFYELIFNRAHMCFRRRYDKEKYFYMRKGIFFLTTDNPIEIKENKYIVWYRKYASKTIIVNIDCLLNTYVCIFRVSLMGAKNKVGQQKSEAQQYS